MSSLSSVVFWLILTAVNSKTGSSTLCDIANVYETLGRFLSDLNLLSEVCIGFSGCCTDDELFQLSSGNQLVVAKSLCIPFVFVFKENKPSKMKNPSQQCNLIIVNLLLRTPPLSFGISQSSKKYVLVPGKWKRLTEVAVVIMVEANVCFRQ